jgi:excisionase family DNA binding protein
MRNWYTIQEVADMYAVSIRTVKNWILAGKIHAYKVGPRLIRIDAGSLEMLCEPVQFQGRIR